MMFDNLNNFDFSSVHESDIMKLINSAQDFIQQAQLYMDKKQTVPSDTAHSDNPEANLTLIAPVPCEPAVDPSHSDNSDDIEKLTELFDNVLDINLMNKLKSELSNLKYHPIGEWDDPETHHFGDVDYLNILMRKDFS